MCRPALLLLQLVQLVRSPGSHFLAELIMSGRLSEVASGLQRAVTKAKSFE